MRISSDDLKHVAKLAELQFSDKEVKKITPQLDRILKHIAKIRAVNTDNVEHVSLIIDVKNVFREDTPADTVSQEDALKNAPLEEDDGFKVPRID